MHSSVASATLVESTLENKGILDPCVFIQDLILYGLEEHIQPCS